MTTNLPKRIITVSCGIGASYFAVVEETEKALVGYRYKPGWKGWGPLQRLPKNRATSQLPTCARPTMPDETHVRWSNDQVAKRTDKNKAAAANLKKVARLIGAGYTVKATRKAYSFDPATGKYGNFEQLCLITDVGKRGMVRIQFWTAKEDGTTVPGASFVRLSGLKLVEEG